MFTRIKHSLPKAGIDLTDAVNADIYCYNHVSHVIATITRVSNAYLLVGAPGTKPTIGPHFGILISII